MKKEGEHSILAQITLLLIAPFVFLWWICTTVIEAFNTPARLEKRARKHTQQLRDSITDHNLDPSQFAVLVHHALKHPLPDYFVDDFLDVIYDLCCMEGLAHDIPPIPAVCNSIEGAKYRDYLARIGARDAVTLAKAARPIAEMFDTILADLPKENGQLSIPFHSIHGKGTTIEIIALPFYSEEAAPLFHNLRIQINKNIHDLSGVPYEMVNSPKLIMPSQYTGTHFEDYLKYTPLLKVYNVGIPLRIPFDLYFEHTHICGGSGSGKSSYLGQFILEMIRHNERPSIVVIDSQDNLIPKVRALKEIQDRLTYIDPRNPPSINLFDKGGAFDVYRYLFSNVLGMEMTGRQETFFKFIVRLLQEVPNATLQDLFNLTMSTDKYEKYIALLPEPHQQFFETDYNQIYKETRSQVRTRLQGIISDETLFKFLWGSTTEIDIASTISSGNVFLINTSRDVLGEASAMFGRVYIFLIMKAVYSRQNTYPMFLIVDEAFEYFSSTIDTMLNQMRKFRCACVFAHQNLNQASQELRASLSSSTAIKLGSTLNVSDIPVFAKEMRTTPDFLTKVGKLKFALYARGVTPTAVVVPVTPGVLEQQETVDIRDIPIIEHEQPVKPLLLGVDEVDDEPSDTL